MRLGKINPHKSTEFASAWFFLCLFPGFFLYHKGLAAGIIPGVLGGFFSPISLIAVAFFIPFLLNFSRSFLSAPIFSYVLLSFFLWTLASALLTYFFYKTDYINEALYQYSNTILNWLALIFIGVCLNFNQTRFSLLLWVSGAVILAVVAYDLVATGSFQYRANILNEVHTGVASYQGLARSALVLGLSLVAISNSLKEQAVVLAGAIFVLFFLSARSEFSAFIIAVAFLYLLRAPFDRGKIIVIASLVGIALVLLSLFGDQMLETRQAKLLNLSADHSWQSRNEMTLSAWDRIREAPLLGQFGGYMDGKTEGVYAHNILSAWDSFGFVGFFLFGLLSLTPALDSFRIMISSNSASRLEIFYFLISASSIVLILAAKSIYWPVPALVWGIYLNVKKSKSEQPKFENVR